MPEPKTEALRTTVEKLVYGGEALARIDGQVLLSRFALPGEEIEVRALGGKGKILRGRDPHVLTPSPHRVQPGCEYFGRCGGCHYQHADYEYQADQKTAILRETLSRLGKITYAGEIERITGPEWQYRNRIQLHFDNGRLGYREAESHKLCAITHCPISSPKLNSVIGFLRDAVKRPEWPAFLRELEIFTNESDVQLNVIDTARPIASRFFSWCAEMIEGVANGPIHYETCGYTLRISRGTFFQVNRFLVDDLVKEALQTYEGETALDLYSGAGLFSLPLSTRFKSVTAVERGTTAYRDLEHNSASATAALTAIQASTDEYLRDVSASPDLILTDPPRAGLGPGVTAELVRIKAPRVVIVSCDPATLSRDLESLRASYEVRRLALVDLFPQTYHFETVAHLELKR